MSSQSLWYLDNIDLSAIFPAPENGSLPNKTSYRTFRKGDFIFVPDDDADKMYFLSEGRVRIGATGEGGREVTKAVLVQGEVFGELALVGEEKRHDFAQAIEETSVRIVPIKELMNLLQAHPELQMQLLRLLGARVLEIERRLESLVFRDSRSRIVEFLLDYARRRGQRVGFDTLVRGFLTHQEIANLTATSRQTVTTTLNALRNKNILTFNRNRLLVRDMDKLEGEMMNDK